MDDADSNTALIVAPPTFRVQGQLGDDEDVQPRRLALIAEVTDKLAVIDDFRPKDELQFVRNLAYKKVVL